MFFNLGPCALKMLQAPRYLNPALVSYCTSRAVLPTAGATHDLEILFVSGDDFTDFSTDHHCIVIEITQKESDLHRMVKCVSTVHCNQGVGGFLGGV